jgi:hypothetical protein
MNINVSTHPDGSYTLTVAEGTREAQLTFDGRTRHTCTFTEDGQPVRVEEWAEGPQAATHRLNADLRCARFVGASFSTAEMMFADAELLEVVA